MRIIFWMLCSHTFKNAFYRVNGNLLMAKLGAYGFDKNTLGWIQDFLV